MSARSLDPSDTFVRRHLGPSDADIAEMLGLLGLGSLEELADQAVPESIRRREPMDLGPMRAEHELLEELRFMASGNEVLRSLIGAGYYDTITPPIIQRNILENPGWYTQYTPYQPEIAQGRLEALMVFQTMVADLCGLPLANSSLLDEGTAAAEAMSMCLRIGRGKRNGFFVASNCHPQTIEVVRTRAKPLGVEVFVGPVESIDYVAMDLFGVLLQYPDTDGLIHDYEALTEEAHGHKTVVVVATDLLALTLLRPPGEWGADIAIGNSQRFGVPLGFGGPHAAFMATQLKHVRKMAGRIVGITKDSAGDPAFRLALQTREQHIKRDRATSNICTAQVLLAIMAAMYTVWHGPDGLLAISRRVRAFTRVLGHGLRKLGLDVLDGQTFDALKVRGEGDLLAAARAAGVNLRDFGDGAVGISLDEKTDRAEVELLWRVLGGDDSLSVDALLDEVTLDYPAPFARTSDFMTHEVFGRFRSEHEMLRYLYRLQGRDLSLAFSMIPLGSCTMKLNATSEMVPVSWPEFGGLHPFVPADQAAGYHAMFGRLNGWLAEITGFPAISLQPNAGSQGEYAGLLVIRAFHEANGDMDRDVCLIPVSAHGTNPASAVMAGFQCVEVACDDQGDIDLADLEARCVEHADRLGALMITYPSTHGVFEEGIIRGCDLVHAHGGQVYMDGANMNAQVGHCRPGDIGADVCHLNLHKTFAIPHGGGGPGMGPIGVAAHLAPFLPGHPLVECGGEQAIGPISAAPFGSPSILPISYVYIALMGAEGLTKATQVAILNANYMAKRLSEHYDILYTGANGLCAHEFVLDARPFKACCGITVEDVAKRLMDYGFHAPTMSWPVAGTLMIEPTESESREELDRFCDAMIAIKGEIDDICEGRSDRDDCPLKGAPHSAAEVSGDEWNHSYSRTQAAWPAPWSRERKFWPPVGRVDNPFGDRNLVLTFPEEG